jgi:hypothetical protein
VKVEVHALKGYRSTAYLDDEPRADGSYTGDWKYTDEPLAARWAGDHWAEVPDTAPEKTHVEVKTYVVRLRRTVDYWTAVQADSPDDAVEELQSLLFTGESLEDVFADHEVTNADWLAEEAELI